MASYFMPKDLEKIRAQALKTYQGFQTVNCPFLKQAINFTSEGLNHIRYRKARKERHPEVQKMRYLLIKFAKQIIEKSHTLQEHYSYPEFVEVKINKRRDKVLKQSHVWGFIAIMKGMKIKVLVKQQGQGLPKFWSIIPNWRTRKTQEGKTFQNYTGNPLED